MLRMMMFFLFVTLAILAPGCCGIGDYHADVNTGCLPGATGQRDSGVSR